MSLKAYGRDVATVFDLLGTDENAMTSALGFALEHAPKLRSSFLTAIGGPTRVANCRISLQKHRAQHGITDIEIRAGDEYFAVIEAKQGAWLPSIDQLSKYTNAVQSSGISNGCIATLSDVTVAFARQALPADINGCAIRHVTWRRVLGMAEACLMKETQSSRRILRDFVKYLSQLLGMDSLFSNRAYVVSLGAGGPDGWPLSWVDVVERHSRYFYPVGKGWPPPPNYLAVRYRGQLQSIHHVEGYDIFTDPNIPFPEVPSSIWPQHYILTLGPAITPQRRVANGPRIRMSNRCWCMVDTLLTSETISDALTETESRIAAWNAARAV